MLNAGQILEGRYKIVRGIQQGGNGTVYEAVATRLGNRRVAVKTLDLYRLNPTEHAMWISNFQREVQLLAGLEHPGVTRIHDYFPYQQTFCIVMDLVDGKSLKQILAERTAHGQQLPLTEILGYAKQLCAILEYLHNQNPPILFRDVKPANIMLDTTGRIKIVDFGIAGPLRAAAAATQGFTAAVGSPGYAAPEQWVESIATDQRTDVFGICATLHELLTGRDPAPSLHIFKPVSKYRPNIPPALNDVIMKGLTADPDHRWQSVTELRLALDDTKQPSVKKPVNCFASDRELQTALAAIAIPDPLDANLNDSRRKARIKFALQLETLYQTISTGNANLIIKDLQILIDTVESNTMADSVIQKALPMIWLVMGRVFELNHDYSHADSAYQIVQQNIGAAAVMQFRNRVWKALAAEEKLTRWQRFRRRLQQKHHYLWSLIERFFEAQLSIRNIPNMYWGKRTGWLFDLSFIVGIWLGYLTAPSNRVETSVVLVAAAFAWVGTGLIPRAWLVYRQITNLPNGYRSQLADDIIDILSLALTLSCISYVTWVLPYAGDGVIEFGPRVIEYRHQAESDPSPSPSPSGTVLHIKSYGG